MSKQKIKKTQRLSSFLTLLVFLSFLILLVSSSLAETYPHYDFQSPAGQQKNTSPRNINQSFMQGRTVWIVSSIIIVVLVLAMIVFISYYFKHQFKKNTKLIQDMIHNPELKHSNETNSNNSMNQLLDETEIQEMILRFLNYNENQVLKKLIEHKGIVLQSEISRIPSMGKVKAHRVLQDLIHKGIIIKEPYGKTNRIVLQQPLKKIFIKTEPAE